MGRHKRERTKIKVTRNRRIYRTIKAVKEVLLCERPYILFGEAVKDHRLEIEMTQEDLSNKVGFSRPSVCNIENGRQRVSLDDVIKFAKSLKMKPSVLFGKCLE